MPPTLLTLLAIAVSLFCVLFELGGYPLMQPDEGRNAEVAREMLESSAWLVPLYNGLPYLDKPAFYFKAVALSLGLFGEHEAAARAVSAAFALATLLLIHRFCRRHYDARTAAIAVIVVATTPLFIAFSRIVIFDMTLAFFVSAAIIACFEAAESADRVRRVRHYRLAAAAIGCATLVKGPVGFVVPTLVTAAQRAWIGDRRWWHEAFAWQNIAIFLALVLPWFVGVSLQQPDFPYYGLVKESLQRFTSNEFHRAAPFYYYAVIIALCFLPWSALLPGAIAMAWRNRGRIAPADRLLMSWTIVVVLFFSLSQSKLPGYILTGVIALGVLTGRLFAVAIARGEASHARAAVRGGALVLAVSLGLAAALIGLIVTKPDVLASLPPKTTAHLADLTPLFRPLAWLLAGSAVLALYGLVSRDPRRVLSAFIIFPLLLVVLTTRHVGSYIGPRSARELAEHVPELGRDVQLACYMCFPNGLPFYLKRPIAVVSYKDGRELESNYVRFRLLDAPVWPEPMIRESDFRGWVERRDQPVYLLVKQRDLTKVGELLGPTAPEFAHLAGEYWGGWIPAGAASAGR
ncbi:MAG: glycosyltransferase family 39 protein [Methylotetracoccus sp.]